MFLGHTIILKNYLYEKEVKIINLKFYFDICNQQHNFY